MSASQQEGAAPPISKCRETSFMERPYSCRPEDPCGDARKSRIALAKLVHTFGKRAFRAIFLRILPALAGLSLLAVLFYRLGPQSIETLIRQTGWRFFGMVPIFAAQEMIRATIVLQSLPDRSRPAFREMLYIRFVGEAVRAVTLTGPFLSEPVRAWFIKRRGVQTSEAAAATIGDFLIHGLASAALTIVGCVYFLQYIAAPGGLRVAVTALVCGSAAYIALVALILYGRVRLIGAIARGVAYVPGLRRRSLHGARRAEAALLAIVRGRSGLFMRLLALQFSAHVLLLAETYWAIRSMGIDVSAVTTSLAEVLTKVVNVAAFVGVAEGAYAVLFAALGLPAAAGFTLSLLKRVRSLTVGLAGMASLALLSSPRTRLH